MNATRRAILWITIALIFAGALNALATAQRIRAQAFTAAAMPLPAAGEVLVDLAGAPTVRWTP